MNKFKWFLVILIHAIFQLFVSIIGYLIKGSLLYTTYVIDPLSVGLVIFFGYKLLKANLHSTTNKVQNG